MLHGLVPLLAVMLLLGAALAAGLVMLMAQLLLRPPRMTDGKAVYRLQRLSPGDLGLHFEDMVFAVRDERSGQTLHLAAWWIPHRGAQGRCVLLIHGYADAKVGAIAWAPLFHDLGINILTIDLRAHGQSDGRYSTAGYFERDDVNQVINQIQAQRPDETRHLVLFGISLGSAVAAATAVRRDDLAAVILESPFADFRRAAVTHGNLVGLPGAPFQRLALRLAQWLSGADFGAVCPVDMVPRITCPLMVIHSGDDALVPPEEAARIEAAAASRPPAVGPTVYWRIPNVPHVMGLSLNPQEYARRIGNFLQWCQEPSAADQGRVIGGTRTGLALVPQNDSRPPAEHQERQHQDGV